MADFCNFCSKRMWGDKDDNLQPIPPDIDVYAEFKKLEPDTYVSGFICEGCGLIAVGNIHGDLRVARLHEVPDGTPEEFITTWEPYEDKSHI